MGTTAFVPIACGIIGNGPIGGLPVEVAIQNLSAQPYVDIQETIAFN
jgi:hypothetical protein